MTDASSSQNTDALDLAQELSKKRTAYEKGREPWVRGLSASAYRDLVIPAAELIAALEADRDRLLATVGHCAEVGRKLIKVVQENCMDDLYRLANQYTVSGYPNLDKQDQATYAEVLLAVESARKAFEAASTGTPDADSVDGSGVAE